jgi:hypothetical protein
MTDEYRFDFRQGQEIIHFFTASRPALGPGLLSKEHRVPCSLGLKGMELEACYSPSFIAEDKNAWNHTSAAPYAFLVLILIKYTENFRRQYLLF